MPYYHLLQIIVGRNRCLKSANDVLKTAAPPLLTAFLVFRKTFPTFASTYNDPERPHVVHYTYIEGPGRTHQPGLAQM